MEDMSLPTPPPSPRRTLRLTVDGKPIPYVIHLESEKQQYTSPPPPQPPPPPPRRNRVRSQPNFEEVYTYSEGVPPPGYYYATQVSGQRVLVRGEPPQYYQPLGQQKPVLIEQTPKSCKALMLVGGCVFAFGIFAFLVVPSFAILLILAGIFIIGGAQGAAWWESG